MAAYEADSDQQAASSTFHPTPVTAPRSSYDYPFYTISSDSLTSLLAASNESLRSMELIALDEDNVAKLILEADDLHEIAVDYESFTEIYDQITAISGNSFVDSYDDAEHILRIEIENSDGMTTEFSFYAHDVDSYACPQTDGSILLVSADGIDKLVRMLR